MGPKKYSAEMIDDLIASIAKNPKLDSNQQVLYMSRLAGDNSLVAGPLPEDQKKDLDRVLIQSIAYNIDLSVEKREDYFSYFNASMEDIVSIEDDPNIRRIRKEWK